MSSSGVTRKVDQLGRVVLPVEVRRTLGLREGDLVDVALEGDRILLTKVEARCIFCGSGTELRDFVGKRVCSGCVGRLTDSGA
jgi:AbrB family transcriptional regulator, transcriptional pleiotropic regulator of transition state genes